MNPSRALIAAGWSSNELNILRDFGEDFFGGVYRHYANRFGEQLVRLVENPGSTKPKASILREGASVVLGVAARDYRGLAATISGTLWHRKVEVRQAHLFSAMHHGLAFDFFHIAPGEAPLPPDLATAVEEAIQGRLHIHEQDEPRLPQVTGNASLREWRPGQFCLRFVTTMDAKGLIYALTYKVFRALRGNIFGLTAHSARGQGYASVYLNLPADLSFEQARLIVEQQF